MRAQRPATFLFDESVVFDDDVVANHGDASDALRRGIARLDGILDAAEHVMRRTGADVPIARFHLSHAAIDGERSSYDASTNARRGSVRGSFCSIATLAVDTAAMDWPSYATAIRRSAT